MIRAGIIGCGKIAGGYNLKYQKGKSLTHACSYKELENVELVAICDPSEIARDDFAKRWNIKNSFSNIESMINNVDLDIVSICSPTECHLEAFEVLNKTNIKGVFCEKPLSYNLQESYRIYSLGIKKKVSINYFRRWNPSFVDLRSKITSKKFGDVKAIHVYYTKGLYVNASHFIDLLSWFFGDPINVRTNKKYPIDHLDLGVDFLLEFKNEAVANFTHIPSVPYTYLEVDIFTNKAKVKIFQRGQKIQINRVEPDKNYKGVLKIEPTNTEKTQWENCITRALSELIDAITIGGDLSCDLQDALKVSEICDKIKKGH